MNRDEIRNELINEIMAGYDQVIDLLKNGGAAALSGHAYDPEENAQKVEWLEQLKQGLSEMLV